MCIHLCTASGHYCLGVRVLVPIGSRVSGAPATSGHAGTHVGPGGALASPAMGCSHSPAKPRAGVLGRLVALQLFAGGSDAEPCWARSHAADVSIPCALLTGNLIYAIIKVKNRAFQHGSHFACTLQWVSANSAAVVCSAWNPGEWLLSRGISSDLIAKL